MHTKNLKLFFSLCKLLLNFYISMIKVATAEEGGEGLPEGEDEEESGH